ncbi:MAG: GvpL/GvpF family gas vesicle protein [Pirellula sp.]|jgi:hypothetical protein
MSNALYLLGFSPILYLRDAEIAGECEYYDPETLALAELFGIERLQAGSVFAWFKRVDRSEFEGEAGERNLSDINWLTPRVMAHDHAIGQLNKQSTFYPSRFGTLFSTDQALSSFTRSVTPTLLEFFRRIKGKQEWGIKLFGNYAHAAQKTAHESGIIQKGASLKGANYLKLKQMQRDLSRSAGDVFHGTLEVAISSIQQVFPILKRRPTKAAVDGGSIEKLLASVAILELIENVDVVATWVERWNYDSEINAGIRLELSGPWPAYTFCPTLNLVDTLNAGSQTIAERGAA